MSQSPHISTEFALQACTVADIPQMYDVYNAAFSVQPTNDIIFPPALVDGKEKRELFLRKYEGYFEKGTVRFYKIVEVNGVEEGGKVVAWMKWGFPLEDEAGKVVRGSGEMEETVETGSGWPIGTNLEFVDRHYGMIDRWQEKHVEPRETFVAHFLCTSPEYQRKGFATQLLRVGLDRADEEGRKTYIEASPDGYPLYLKLGFKEVERDTFSLREWGGRDEDLGGHVCMIREPKL